MQESHNDQIEQYLLGKLKGKQKAAFEDQLKSDKELAKEVELQRLLVEQVESMGAMEVKQQLLDIKKDLEGRRRGMIRRMLGLAAAAAIALLVFGVQFMGSEVSHSDLYGEYYSSYELPFTSRAETQDEDLAKAGMYYQGKDFSKAIPVLEKILKSNPNDSRSRLALGISQIELGKETEALANLNQIIEANDPLYLDQARWYTALTYLNQNNIKACRQQLILLSANSRAPHYKQAQELLKKIAK